MPLQIKPTPADVLYYTPTGMKWLVWNPDVETWEPTAEAKWYECGETLAAINRLCTKFIGHDGPHGQR